MSSVYHYGYRGLGPFLRDSMWVDYHHPSVLACACRLWAPDQSEKRVLQATFEFVRDEIRHSFDAGLTDRPFRASEVLQAGHGICFAKANLFAALLRSNGIAVGFAYQSLVFDSKVSDEQTLHGFNVVYLKGQQRWCLLDARGDNEMLQTPFVYGDDCLAFDVDSNKGEQIYLQRYVEPVPAVCASFSLGKSWTDPLSQLPKGFDYG